jgi:hypothetical protein
MRSHFPFDGRPGLRVLLQIAACGALIAAPAFAAKVSLQGDFVTVTARDEALRDVLAGFVEAGIEVQIDPTIRDTISINAKHEPVEAVLAEMVLPYGYALSWGEVRTPMGILPRLEQIRVFRIGQETTVKPLERSNALQTIREWDGQEYVADELLISFRPGTSVDEFKRLLAQIGATVLDCNTELGIYRIRFAPGTNIRALLQQLERNEHVAGVEPNYAYRTPEGEWTGSSFPTADGSGRALPAAKGAAALAILDSGLLTSAGLEDAVVGTFDAFNPDGSISDPVGHGTQMALIASGAVTPGGAAGAGEGQGVPLLAVKAFDENGVTSNFDLMRGMDYALQNGARVINLSWGSETPSAFIERAMLYARSRGAIVVASAGNEPHNRPVYPAAYPGVLAVGALDPDGTRWAKSNYGDFVDLTAPGAANMPVGYRGPPGSYAGTSIANAHTSRVIAQYLMQNPGSDAQDVLNALAASLTDAGDPGRDDEYGVGKLDADAVRRFLGQ